DGVVVSPRRANRAEDRPLTDDGLHSRPFERVAHRSSIRSNAVERRLSSPVSSIVVSNGRPHAAILRHVDRRRTGPDRGGRTHEHDANRLVVDQSITGGLCLDEPLARNTVGGRGSPQVGVRSIDLRELPEGASAGGTLRRFKGLRGLPSPSMASPNPLTEIEQRLRRRVRLSIVVNAIATDVSIISRVLL